MGLCALANSLKNVPRETYRDALLFLVLTHVTILHRFVTNVKGRFPPAPWNGAGLPAPFVKVSIVNKRRERKGLRRSLHIRKETEVACAWKGVRLFHVVANASLHVLLVHYVQNDRMSFLQSQSNTC
jgi:hypothetical protein